MNSETIGDGSACLPTPSTTSGGGRCRETLRTLR